MSEYPANKLEILKRKGQYPYEWVDCYEKFNYQQLPSKQCFYSSLKDGKWDKGNGHISNEECLYLYMYIYIYIYLFLYIFLCMLYIHIYIFVFYCRC